ncbi:MAG: sulfite oxidase-like oxidoreductase [Alphaproteobacteria bacterium]
MADDGDNLVGKIKSKLIEQKRKWAKDGRLLTGESAEPAARRLPPGQHEVKNWPVLDLGIQPMLPPARWKLAIDGLVERPVEWKWDDFQSQPQTQFKSDIHCVTAWSRFDNRWEGVSARHVMALVRPKPEAEFVIFHSFDSYTTNVRREAFDDDDVLLAHSWEGEKLTREHGGPVRIVLPKLYFWKSAKWIKRIEFAATDRPGFWEERGYHNNGDPWTEERYG